MITLKINNKEITVKDGTLILDAAKEAGFDIPTFCYQARISGLGSCRMCLIEIEGQKKLQPACITPVLPGVSILTESSSISSMRSAMLEFLLSNHALDCPVCDKAGECELQDLVYKHGPRNGRFDEVKIRFHEEDYAISPVIVKTPTGASSARGASGSAGRLSEGEFWGSWAGARIRRRRAFEDRARLRPLRHVHRGLPGRVLYEAALQV